MGFLDRFKKKNKEESEIHPEAQVSRSREFSGTNFKVKMENSSIQLDYYNPEKQSEFYDTTRIILNERAHSMIEGEDVYTAFVSWYGQDDCVMLVDGQEVSRAGDYKKILTSIDINLLLTDPQYRSVVMNYLLDERRVGEYLARGLTDNPKMPSGNYIGGVTMSEKGWRKYFSPAVGRVVHNMPQNVSKRQELRRKREMNDQRRIAELQSEIEQIKRGAEGVDR